MNKTTRYIEIPAPLYQPPKDSLLSRSRQCIGLAVECMKRHMTDEGWQLFAGLQDGGGYLLYGHNLPPRAITDVPTILDSCNPLIVVVQDKREWEGLTAGGNPDRRIRFNNSSVLKKRDDIFRVTVLKDAQNSPSYHRDAADEIGTHAWIVYYLPSRVKRVARYVREKHLIRTYHTVDRDVVPTFSMENRRGCLISGATSTEVYPLRTLLTNSVAELPETTSLPHPGYHRNGSCTPHFLKILSKYKVAICTASVYGYALRKIIEATACGCTVITDLPKEDVLPGIDGNLYRVSSKSSVKEIANLIRVLLVSYDPDKQSEFARTALDKYDYRAEGKRLANSIEDLRCRWALI